MPSTNWVLALILAVLGSTISTAALSADPIIIDDDLKEIEARFNAELEKMRQQFRAELEQAQSGPRDELNRANRRIRQLERENALLMEELTKVNARLASMANRSDADTEDNAPVSNARGYLGISIVEIDGDQARRLEVNRAEAVIVEKVETGSTASEMGLKPGDAIFAIEGQGASYDTLVGILTDKKAGQSVTAAWARAGDDGVVKVRGRGILKANRQSSEPAQVSQNDNGSSASEEPEPAVVQRGITFGINVVQDEGFGLRITSVEPGSNAAVAGLKVGDIVAGFGDAKVRTIEGLRDVLSSTVVGSRGQIVFSRNGETWSSQLQFGGGDVAALLIGGPRKSTRDTAQTNDRGFLGIVPVEQGDSVVVSEVITGSCAEQMGLKQGDLLVAVAGKMITSIDVLRSALENRNVGESIEVRFARAGEPRQAEGVLGKFPVTEGQSSVPTIQEASRPVRSSARIENPRPTGNGKLGIVVAWDADGAYIDAILPGSGAGSAGALVGDRILRVDEVAIGSLEQIGEVLSGTMAGSPISLEVLRGNQPFTLVAHRREMASAPSFPNLVEAVAAEPPVLGMEVEENAIGILVTDVHEESMAQASGLQQGDWIIRVCEMEVRSIEDMQDSLQYSGLSEIQITIRRDLEILQLMIPLQR